MKRNTIVSFAVLFILATFAWAGWANWEYRKQAAARSAAMAASGADLAADTSSGTLVFHSPLTGKPAPDFTLDDLNGKAVSLANYRGKAVMINFWATWCTPCQIETPWIVELRDKYASQGFEVLGVSSQGDDATPKDKTLWDKDKAAIAKFAQQKKLPYPVLLGGDGISKPYGGVEDLPTSFFVNRKGVVVATEMGLTSESDLEADIQKALKD
ncbi:MAG TPA: TlpA disulfide reductase family protein [Terracidiphilus sp.]|nr:TlpA disulfide reductase family protein [Terracidiphilus sp.]